MPSETQDRASHAHFTWFLNREGVLAGPFSTKHIQSLLRLEKITRDQSIFCKEDNRWGRIYEFPIFERREKDTPPVAPTPQSKSKKITSPPAPTPTPVKETPEVHWHLYTSGQVVGPYSTSQLKENFQAGNLPYSSLLSQSAEGPWKTAGDYVEFNRRGTFSSEKPWSPPPIPSFLLKDLPAEVPIEVESDTDVLTYLVESTKKGLPIKDEELESPLEEEEAKEDLSQSFSWLRFEFDQYKVLVFIIAIFFALVLYGVQLLLNSQTPALKNSSSPKLSKSPSSELIPTRPVLTPLPSKPAPTKSALRSNLSREQEIDKERTRLREEQDRNVQELRDSAEDSVPPPEEMLDSLDEGLPFDYEELESMTEEDLFEPGESLTSEERDARIKEFREFKERLKKAKENGTYPDELIYPPEEDTY